MFATLATAVLFAQSTLIVPLDLSSPSKKVSRGLFGVFFEEINHSGDGGLYPELLKNPNMHYDKGLAGWGSSSFSDGHLATSKHVGDHGSMILYHKSVAFNFGYWGIRLAAHRKYILTLKFSGAEPGDIEAWIDNNIGNSVKFNFTRHGQSLESEITPKEDVATDSLKIANYSGTTTLVSASLKPTRLYGKAGLREDLGEAVHNLNPAFVRFPGGCYVEGGDYLKDRFNWKSTLVDPSERPGHKNATWGYWSTDGLGFHEYLQWCEDMHAEPLFVLNCGMSHKEALPLDKMQPYVQDALDAFEYANGPVTSKWGALRAAHGHPKPFGLRRVEIGNENGLWSGFGGTRDMYRPHYDLIYNALKAKYPDLIAIGDTRLDSPMDFVDDHYYSSPDWFWQNVGLYDDVTRQGPKVYVGEYAVTTGCGHGNLVAAIAEAAFMTGLERNGDLVQMASYAPLFVRDEDRAWNPDAIVFNGSQWYGTPSYWTQYLFSHNPVDRIVPLTLPSIEAPISGGGVGVGSWATQVEYQDVRVELPNGEVHQAAKWLPGEGQWKTGAVISQTSKAQPAHALVDDPALANATDYTLRLKARKTSGDEGFLVLFRAKDHENFIWWNIGGWGNTRCAVEKETGGGRGVISKNVPFHVETGRWYDIAVTVHGQDLDLSIDGNHIQSAKDRSMARLAGSAGIDDKRHEAVIKLVNGDETEHWIDLDQLKSYEGRKVEITTLGSTVDSGDFAALQATENSFKEPQKVKLSKGFAVILDGHLKLLVKRDSVVVARWSIR